MLHYSNHSIPILSNFPPLQEIASNVHAASQCICKIIVLNRIKLHFTITFDTTFRPLGAPLIFPHSLFRGAGLWMVTALPRIRAGSFNERCAAECTAPLSGVGMEEQEFIALGRWRRRSPVAQASSRGAQRGFSPLVPRCAPWSASFHFSS